MSERIPELMQHLPAHMAATLRPPATPEEIAAIEQVVGSTLPEALRHAYGCHDGQNISESGDIFGDYRWLTVKGVLSDWRIRQELLEAGAYDELNSGDEGDPVRMDWWNPKWIPFARSVSGDCLCVDLAPGASGTTGQVISVFHDDETREVLAVDFEALLASVVP